MKTPKQEAPRPSSVLPAEHAEAQQLAEDASRLRASGDEDIARSLYARAAQLEATALRAIPKDKHRTIGIIGLSVASLWFRAGEYASARSAANELLSAELLPSARAALEELLEAIAHTERKPDRSLSSDGIVRSLGVTRRYAGAYADHFVDRLRAHLTPSSPLGPWDAAQLRDMEVAARLFDPHNRSFNTLLRRDLSVLAGRRGSGKTALLNSYNYRSFLERSGRSRHTDYGSYDVVLTVETYKHFDDMQRLVVRDPHAFRPVESIVDDWEAIVCDYFFARLVAEETESGRTTQHIAALQRYLKQDEDAYKSQIRELVWGVNLLDRLRQMVAPMASSPVRMTRDEALAAAVAHLEATQHRALILFDSMDEYDIGNPTFNRTVAALIRFVTHFNSRQDRIAVKVVLPSEIFPEITRASANPLKDLVSVDQLVWSASELAQLAAHRYRLFLELYDPDHAEQLQDLDLNHRQELRVFWQRFFPAMHSNRYGAAEETMTYILRHTQLLPRQLLLILQRIIVSSYRETGGYRSFSHGAIIDAVESTETLIASEILRAFAHVYPNAEQLCKPVFANLATVFSFDQLEDKWRKKGRPAAAAFDSDFGMPQFAEMLIRMGIVGAAADETERYFEGRFAYDAFQPMNIGEGHMLCLHPIFSRHFNAAGNDKRKAIVPQGLGEV